jgi:hypothetical protein
LADSFVGDEDPTGEQQLFDIPMAETEAEIEPDAVADDLGREAMVWGVGWCGSIHNSPKTVYRYEERAFLSGGAMVKGWVCHIVRRLYRLVEKLTMPPRQVALWVS